MNYFNIPKKIRNFFFYNSQGNISLLAAFGIFTGILVIALVVNIGNLFAKKNLVQDTADATSSALLAHQIVKCNNPGAEQTAASVVADNYISDQNGRLDGSQYNITYGILNKNTGDPGLPDGFYDFNDNRSGNAGIDTLDPDLDNVILKKGQDFAVAYQLDSPTGSVAQLGQLMGFNVTLKGKSMSATGIGTLPDPPIDKKNQCCCSEVAGGDPWMFGTMCAIPNGTVLGVPVYAQCPFFPNLSWVQPKCTVFNQCTGTTIIDFFTGAIFKTIFQLFHCWWQDFIERLINTIHKVDQAVSDAWDGWT